MIHISRQLVPGCLSGRGNCQLYLQRICLRRCSVHCHFPSDSHSLLTGAGGNAIPWAIREESRICVRSLWGADQVGGGHRGGLQDMGCRPLQISKLHSPLFRLKFLRDWLLSLGWGSSSQHAATGSLYQICHIDPLSLPINILHVAIIVCGI